MRFKKILCVFGEGFKVIKKNPVMILAGVVLWIILEAISLAGKFWAINFQTTGANIVWTIAVAFVSFIAGSYFLAGLIGVFLDSKNRSKRKFFVSANKFWLRSFFIVLFILLVSLIIGRVAHYGAYFIGKSVGLVTLKAVVLFVLIYFAGLVGVLNFLTFSNVFLVKKNLKIQKAVRESINFVKKEYLATLFLNVVFFVLFWGLDSIKSFVGDVLLFGLLLPYFIAVLTRFVETADLKKSEK